ncbi:hypothetical protein [Kitasatospora sp. NPDC059571]|uniref:hypothetical protein n=1 Tax=Kitasatospora sp. NPDC059571 TaxID=3346871 RepID=UPI0036C61935
MAYGPVAYGPVVRERRRGGGLVAIGVLLLVQLVSELCVLGYDVARKGPVYLLDALGLTYEDYVDAPVGFFGYDTALCVALVALAIGAFSGGRWVRPAAVPLLGVGAFQAAAQLGNQLFTAEGRHGFAAPVGHLLLNLTLFLTVGIAIAVAAIVAATRPAAPAPAPAPPGLPYPPYVPQQRQGHPPIPPTTQGPHTPPNPPPTPPEPPKA